MKTKFGLKLITIAALAAVGSAAAFAQSDWNGYIVRFDGQGVSFYASSQPFYIGNQLMVPVRDVADETGVGFWRSGDGQLIQLSFDGQNVTYLQGDMRFQLDGEWIGLNEPSANVDGVLYVPIRLFTALENNQIQVNPYWHNGWEAGYSGDQQPVFVRQTISVIQPIVIREQGGNDYGRQYDPQQGQSDWQNVRQRQQVQRQTFQRQPAQGQQVQRQSYQIRQPVQRQPVQRQTFQRQPAQRQPARQGGQPQRINNNRPAQSSGSRGRSH